MASSEARSALSASISSRSASAGSSVASWSRTASSLLRLRPASAQRSPEGACSARYSAVSAPVKPVAPSRTTSRLRWSVRRFGGRHDADSPTRGTTPSIRPSDQRTPLIRADAPATSSSTAEGPAMPLRRSVTRTVTRTLVALTAVVGLGAAFVAGTSYGGSDHAGTGRAGGAGADASPAAYSGCDLTLAGVLRRPAGVVRRARPGPGRPVRVGTAIPTSSTTSPRSSAGGDAVRAPMAAQAPAPRPRDERRDRHQRAGGRRRRAGRRQDRRRTRCSGSRTATWSPTT